MSKRSKYLKNGLINPTEVNHTGSEPDWSDLSELNENAKVARVSRAFNFYNYYCDRDDYLNFILAFMVERGHTPQDIKQVKKCPKEIPIATEGKVARMLNMQGPEIVEGKDYVTFVNNKIAQIIRYVDMHTKTNKEYDKQVEKLNEVKAPVIPPMKRLENKVHSEVIAHIDWALDEWVDDYANVAPVGVTALLGGANIPSKGCKFVTDFLDKYLIDLYDAKSGECDQCVEAYSFLSKVQLNKWIRTFEKMKADVEKYEKANKKAVVRTKKVKPAIQQVQNLKYLTENDGTKSVPPVRLCGAMVAYTYNVKTNKLAKYQSLTRNGLSVKGTSIKDFDSDTSYTFTVRKNIKDDVFKQLNKKDVIKGMDNIKDSTKTKVAIPNGRINEHTLLIYAK
jgi:hypothetical protein